MDIPVESILITDALQRIRTWIERREPNYVCCVPAHVLMDCHDHPELRPVYVESGMNTPDGMAVVWLLRLKGHRQTQRVYGPDLLLMACERSLQMGWSHYFYGGKPEVVQELVDRLRGRFAGLQVAGWKAPPFRALTPEEQAADLEEIRASGADIVWVGLGSPRQEVWMRDNYRKLGRPVLVGVGAAFDFLSGAKPQAPRWIQRIGMEWLFRLFSEPKRLWKRYVLGYPRFILLAIADLIKR